MNVISTCSFCDVIVKTGTILSVFINRRINGHSLDHILHLENFALVSCMYTNQMCKVQVYMTTFNISSTQPDPGILYTHVHYNRYMYKFMKVIGKQKIYDNCPRFRLCKSLIRGFVKHTTKNARLFNIT